MQLEPDEEWAATTADSILPVLRGDDYENAKLVLIRTLQVVRAQGEVRGINQAMLIRLP